ncbi:MAG: hypothetical protein AAGU21_13275 [Solidesulfovibrio sp.]|uniref:hypothetical protein n=1 Tax=Solidesulfovibrio sp. TaxID=2910990 RepID=UPI002B1FF5E2|nr:hypothetical protein [Solidesulfovibrio sp.]MEA4857490.1 hypothetical protein [Solidesulfovibrio sp.]
MGLHDSILDVPERLRIWQLAGVRYFYCDPDATSAAAAPPASAVSPEAQPLGEPPDRVREPSLPSVADDPATWPPPWPAFFAKAPARPRLVLTYAALGDDMTGNPDPRRGPMWRRLFADSGLAGRNLVAFWPVCLPGETDPALSVAVFLSGLRLLQPRLLAVFGEIAGQRLAALAPRLLPDNTRFLPDPNVLLQGDKEVWDHVASILGSS